MRKPDRRRSIRLSVILGVLLVVVGAAVTAFLMSSENEKPLTVAWQKTFVGAYLAYAGSIVALPDGGFAVAGTIKSKTGGYDAWVLRLDREGRALWSKTYGGKDIDQAVSLAALPNGGFVVVGATRSKGQGKLDAWVLRIDGKGELLWDKVFGGTDNDSASSVVALPGGGIAVVGTTDSKGAGDSDGWLLRLDDRGNLLWDKTIGGKGIDMLYSLVVPQGGGFAASGSRTIISKEHHLSDAWVVRLDDRGKVLWERIYGRGDNGAGYSIINLPDGGFAMAGEAHLHEKVNKAQMWRLDNTGRVLWKNGFRDTALDRAVSIAALPDGGFAVAGQINPVGLGKQRAGVFRLDGKGRLLWKKAFGGADRDLAIEIVAVPSGGLAVAGQLGSKTGDDQHPWVLRLAPPAEK